MATQEDKLFEACSALDLTAVREAVEAGAKLDTFDKYGDTPLGVVVNSWDIGARSDEQEEINRIVESNKKKQVEIARYLLASGSQPDLCGGKHPDQPLEQAYWAKNFDLIKLLLEAGADPNISMEPETPGERSGILGAIDFLIGEDYGQFEADVEDLVRSYGGRLYWWDWDPHTFARVGKYCIQMLAAKNGLFIDNAGWYIGDDHEIAIEDADDKVTKITIDIPGLRQWQQDYITHIKNGEYDWLTWQRRGRKLAEEVAAQLPDNVILYYSYDEKIQAQKNWNGKGFHLSRPVEPERIK